MTLNTSIRLLAIAALVLSLGCNQSESGTAEKIGKNIDDITNSTRARMSEASDDVADSINQMGTSINETADDIAEESEQILNNAEDASDDITEDIEEAVQ